MAMEMQSVNFLAIVVSAIVSMALGMLWYGPLFGKAWMKMAGLSKEDMEKAKKAGMAKAYVITLFGALIMAYVLAHFVQAGNLATITGGAMIGFWAWLGFVATTSLSPILWEKKPWSLYVLNNGYTLAVLLANGAILAVWR